MKNEPVQDYILKSERNLAVAAAVGEAWPQVRGKLVSAFLDRLDSRLKKKLKGWKSEQDGEGFFNKPYPGYYIGKPAWNGQYWIRLECYEYGNKMVFGVAREHSIIGKRPHCEELFATMKDINPSVTSHKWWEARTTMRSPAPDWRKPEVLWQMHKDGKFLNDVAEQLLEVAEISGPFIDRWVRKHPKI
jgi:hypothetical protein